MIINIVKLFFRTRFFALRGHNKQSKSNVDITGCANSSTSVAMRVLVDIIK